MKSMPHVYSTSVDSKNNPISMSNVANGTCFGNSRHCSYFKYGYGNCQIVSIPGLTKEQVLDKIVELTQSVIDELQLPVIFQNHTDTKEFSFTRIYKSPDNVYDIYLAVIISRLAVSERFDLNTLFIKTLQFIDLGYSPFEAFLKSHIFAGESTYSISLSCIYDLEKYRKLKNKLGILKNSSSINENFSTLSKCRYGLSYTAVKEFVTYLESLSNDISEQYEIAYDMIKTAVNKIVFINLEEFKKLKNYEYYSSSTKTIIDQLLKVGIKYASAHRLYGYDNFTHCIMGVIPNVKFNDGYVQYSPELIKVVSFDEVEEMGDFDKTGLEQIKNSRIGIWKK